MNFNNFLSVSFILAAFCFSIYCLIDFFRVEKAYKERLKKKQNKNLSDIEKYFQGDD